MAGKREEILVVDEAVVRELLCQNLDLVLTDIIMPKVDGHTALAALSQLDRAFSMGAANYLVRPFSAIGLKKAVARVLYRKRLCRYAV